MIRTSKIAAGLFAAVMVGVFSTAPAVAQQQEKVLMVEDVFKNVTELKGIPVNEFMDTMGFFAAAIGLNCTGCHTGESLQDWSKFADDIPRKRMARNMIRMVNALNKSSFGGRRAVTCWTCHRGGGNPPVIPSLNDQYSIAPEDPDAIEIVPDGPKEPTADQIFTKYIDALGGAQKLSALTSYTAKGTIEGFDTYHQKVPYEVYAKAPNQKAVIWHTQNGDSATVFDGTNGWIARVDNPVRLIPMLRGWERDAGRLDAALGFPGGIKQALTDWKVGFPPTTIDDKEVVIVQGIGADKSRFKLYFESESGYLVRVLRYEDTPIGMVPIRTDYSDYKDVAGVKLPFKTVITWTDGQSHIELSEVQPNANVPATRFNKPAEAVVKAQGGR
jgi:photosynthetic reaction center cytochrome c subunit